MATTHTSNILDSAQRAKLLKSTQKLGALLGTTPRVFDIHAPTTPATPKTRAFRREGKVFHNQSASSSSTSLSSTEEPSYVWIQHAPSPPAVPISIDLRLPVKSSEVAGHRKTQSSHHKVAPLSQPLLYRLRSVPVVPKSTATSTVAVVPQELNTMPPISPILDNIVKPSSRRNNSMKDLSKSDRRRKMAKLTRTLGENVPPELVFGVPRSTTFNNAVANEPKMELPRRKRSATGAQRPSAKALFTTDPDIPTVPTLPNTPTPATLVPPMKHQPSISGISITTTTTTVAIDVSGQSKRRHRPRSLTLTHIPTVGRQQGIVIEQERVPQRMPSRSLDEPSHRNNVPDVLVASGSSVYEPVMIDYGRRKEREWSGEWNVKDMEDVAKALRNLRGR